MESVGPIQRIIRDSRNSTRFLHGTNTTSRTNGFLKFIPILKSVEVDGVFYAVTHAIRSNVYSPINNSRCFVTVKPSYELASGVS